MLKKIYYIFGAGVISLYALSNLIGFEVSPPKEIRSLGIMRVTKTKPTPGSTYPGSGRGPYSSGRGGK